MGSKRYLSRLERRAEFFAQSYTEMRRRRKETEVARRIKGGNEKEGLISR